MFFKKKQPKFNEAPLYYWEEKSYMLAILSEDTNDEELLKNSFDRIASVENLEIKENHYSVEENTFYASFSYENDDYEIGFYLGGVTIPEYYLEKNFLFKEEEKKILLEAKKAITIFMKFNNNPKKSYHLQLKLAVVLVPNLIGILDESAEKMLPSSWVKMAVASRVLPNPDSLFTVQAVTGEKKVWLHTHGLNRCGITELEILESDAENYRNHYHLISTFAKYLIDKKEPFHPREESAYIGCLIDGIPVVVTCRSWTEGILEYPKLDLGGITDREQGHNSNTSIIFLYKSEEDEKNKMVSKVSVYDKIWGENPIFFISNEETARMKELAMERFDYAKEAFKDKENTILIKIGLPLEEEGKFEHIWFELLEIKGKKFKAKLTQEPYNVDNIHEGDEAWYTVEDITDWIIYTPEFAANPDNVYLLEK